MLNRVCLTAMGLSLWAAVPAGAEILNGVMSVRGAEMS